MYIDYKLRYKYKTISIENVLENWRIGNTETGFVIVLCYVDNFVMYLKRDFEVCNDFF